MSEHVETLERSVELSQEEYQRYNRHLILPEVGVEGQKKLKAASVLLIGTGGLGSPLALYLAAAGIGRLGLVDFDVVDSSNLQRQVIHGTSDVGRSKLESARDRIAEINPNVEVDLYETRLSSENALDIFNGYDLVADGTDNFPTRYLVNDASVMTGIPNVYASIFRFEGQVSVFGAKDGPCYRCVYPEPPPPGLVPSCAEGGVLGVLPGIVGSLQASEVIKMILGAGDPLIGRLLLFDALESSFRTLKLRRNPDCPVCGDHPTQTELIDYQQFCGLPPIGHAPAMHTDVPEITVSELAALNQQGPKPFLLDVRKPFEAEIAFMGADQLIPVEELPDRIAEVAADHTTDIVIHCRSGARSARATKMLLEAGFQKVRNLKGGILAWSEEIDPSIPQY
ncbi:MAG: molybdopterin-synthase adenylyltransferase MoeB [Rhodothermales bacterium]|nr:molybdopterin-synthase adenylyltransferase MoeB [Rhodothermales bacterium]